MFRTITVNGTVENTGENDNATIFLNDSNRGATIIVGASGIVRGTTASPYGNAMWLSQGADILELHPGATVTGYVDGNNGIDTLRFGGAGAGTFDLANMSPDNLWNAQYRNFDLFEKTGTSTWTLVGNTPVVMPMFVNGGTLLVNGAMTSSAFTVSAGGTLGGTGSVGTTVISGGTLAPGNSIGTLTVNGNLTFGAGSTYAVEVSPNSTDRTDVIGTADLSGGTVSATYEPGQYVAREHVIVNATGGLQNTTFAGLTGSTPSGIAQRLRYDANNAYLVIDRVAQGATLNQRAVADAINDYFIANGGVPGAFVGLSPEQLAMLSGETGSAGGQAAIMAAGAFADQMSEPQLGSEDGGDREPMAYNETSDGGRHAVQAQIARRFEAGFPSTTPAAHSSNMSAWGSVVGGGMWIAGNSAAGSQNLSSGAVGLMSGIDYTSGGTSMGVALGGSWANFSLDGGRGGGRVGTFSAGVRATHDFGNFYVAGLAAYGYHYIDTSRNVGGVSYEGQLNGHSFTGRAEGGYRHRTDIVDVLPYAAFQLAALTTPGYSETGGGPFALSYAARTNTDTRAEFGMRLSKSFTSETGTVTSLTGHVAWAQAFSPQPAITAGFVALPGTSFATQGAVRPSGTALVSLGVNRAFSNGVSVGVLADGEFGAGFTRVSGKARLSLSW